MNSDVQHHHPSVPHESHAARVRGTGHQSIPSNSTAFTVNESMVPFKLEPTDTTTTTPPNGGVDDTDTDGPHHPEPRVLLERIPTILQPSIPWRERLMHFTFAWYTVTLSTSGVSLVLAITPHRFRGLSTIGLVIFLLDLFFFLVITGSITLRFVLHRLTFRRAFTRPNEALFVPTFFLSIAAILCNVAEYARIFIFDDDISYRFNGHSSTSTTSHSIPWFSNSTLANSTLSSGLGQSTPSEPDDSSAPSASLTSFRTFLCIAFWLFSAVTFLASVIQYHLLFTVKAERRLSLTTITPAWVLPIFPVMLIGTLAGSFSKTQDPKSAIGIICAGLAAQGLGLLVSFFFFSSYLSRLMAFGLPAQRPGMFIAVGPPSFTGAAVISMASDIPRVFEQLQSLNSSQITILTGVHVGSTSTDTLAAGVKLSAIWLGVFLWGLGFWFFVSAVAGIVAGMPADKKFHLSWWSIVFPNVGFTIASIKIGQGLGSEGVLWMGSGLTVALVLAWAFIGYRCVRAVVRREIVWPGHDEDS